MPHPAAERGSATVTVATAAALLLLLIAVIAGAVGGVTGQEAAACTAQPAASSAAASIPANYLADFKKAAAEYSVPWTVLAAIGKVESGFGQNDGPSSAGALGPMQFEPSTWALYGDGGDIMDPADAIPAAARLLAANGAPGNLQQAVFAYNHSGSTSPTSWTRPPATPPGAPGGLRRRQRRVPAGRPRPAARRHRREDPRLRRGAARQALHLRGGRPGRVRLLGPGHDGLPRRRDHHPRTSQAQWAFGLEIAARQVQPGDLVFFAGADGSPAAPGHVGIVLDPAAHTMIDAYAAGYPVEEDTYGLPASKGGLSPVTGFTRPL